MKILLAQAYGYLYTRMGAPKITQRLVEKLAARGHTCRVVAPAFVEFGVTLTTAQFLSELRARNVQVLSFAPDVVIFEDKGVEVHAITDSRGRGRSLWVYMIQQIKRFEPDWIVAPDEYELIDVALQASPENVVALFTTTIDLPFGPEAWQKDDDKARRLRQTAGVIAISHFLKDYLWQWGEIEAEVVQMLAFGDGPFPDLACFDQGFVTLINPCTVKGSPIFQALARQMPEVQFAAVPTWGTTQEDLAALEALPNVHLLPPAENMDDIFAQTRILLVPSLWREVFGLVAVEAMLRGIPVLASNVGGLPEAKLGVDYVLPVRPIERFERTDGHDEPRPVVPEQDIGPWLTTLRRLLAERDHYQQLSSASRQAALAYAAHIEAESLATLDQYLTRIAPATRKMTLTQELLPEQRARLALKLGKMKKDASRIPRLENRDHLPLSFAQQRLWFLAQLVPESLFYNVPTVWQCHGDLNVAALEQSLSEIVRRHESLRTAFPAQVGQPRQVIAPPAPVSVSIVNLEHLPRAEWEAEIQRLAAQEAQQAFDLATGPLFRAALLRQSPSQHVLLVDFHHIVFDGWSTGVFLRELVLLYNAFSAGKPSPLPELPIQYADFAHWQRQWLQGKRLEQHLDYWRQQLDGAPAILDLPTDYPRPEIQSFEGACEALTLPGRLVAALKALSDQHETTLFMTMLTAFNVLLYRYTGQDDIVVGSGIANRNRRELEELVGFFVNVLPIRTHLAGNPTFCDLLQQVRATTIGDYAHQDLPFEKLVEELQPERKLSHAPIFQVSFVYQNFPELPVQKGNVMFSSLRPAAVVNRTSKFDLTLYLVDDERQQKLLMEYSSDLFEVGTVQRMLDHFQALLEGIVADPDGRVAALPVMTARERQTLLVDWNTTLAAYPSERGLHQLFETQVECSPEAVALACGDEAVSYQALNRRANRLAHHLQKLGVEPETLVGVCLERSVDAIVTILAIVKAGGAYVPVDPDYPLDRVAFMLRDSRLPILVTRQSMAVSLPDYGVEMVCVDADWPAIGQQSERNPTSLAAASNLAYVIYTSGSTGQPKGTMLSHRGACNLVEAQRKAFVVEPDSRVFQFASLSFDASVSEIFVTLLSGATLALPTPEIVLPGKELVELLQQQSVTAMTCTPSVWATLPANELPRLRTVISAGEACPASVVAQWAADRRFINAYGPTEASVCATLNDSVSGAGRPAIGRPINNVQIYLLDRRLQPAPLGVVGEIYIGGVGLARGYWQQPALTAARFVPNPFGNEPDGRLYQTGDLARYLPDGNIEFLERTDYQVKVRGFRVELGEIESALEQHPVVHQAVLAAHIPEGRSEADKQLLAYIVLDESNLRKLGKLVPELDIEEEQVSQWQHLFEDSYGRQANDQDPTFNISGWNRSYTGQPISEEEMREWVNQAAMQILAHQPRRVLEIGCGAGLLLFRIAPHCEVYWGTDFSESALDYVRQTLAEDGAHLPQVRLSRQAADDLTGIPLAEFDVVVFNSVVQYFPTVEYLVSVLERAVEATRPGGCVFVGDVRSLPLLEAFCASVQTYKAPPSLPVSELWQHVQRRASEEEELVIDPAFFTALKQHVPRISHVETHLERGQTHNELTKFRYNVCLYVDADLPQVEPDWLDWQADRCAVTSIRQTLSEDRPEVLAIARVPNARLQADLQALTLMSASRGTETVRELREAVLYGSDDGVDPEVFWDLGDRLSYAVSTSWSDGDHGCYDVVFRQPSVQPIKVVKKTEAAILRPWHHYTNNPLQRITSLKLVPFLRLFLQDILPDYMTPSSFIILDSLPLSPSGKVDRRALPLPSDARRNVVDGSFTFPRDPIELQLTHIWQDVLKVQPVGVTDNFFELGGHSLLAVDLMARIEERFGQDLPLSILFQQPTIELIASTLRQKIGFVSESALVAIQPNGSRPPFFCVHPAGGNVICYTDLARRLGTDQPFFGLQDPGLAREREPLTTVEAMAAHYLAALRAVQPAGPYAIGGWSFGALVALEMAQQLQDAGQEIALLAVFDSVAPRIGEQSGQPDDVFDEEAVLRSLVLQEVARMFGISINVPTEELWKHQSADMVPYLLEQLQGAGVAASQKEVVRLVEYGRRYAQVYRRNMAAQARYIARPYHGVVTLFRVKDVQGNPLYAHPLYGWDAVSTPPIDVHLLPGTHHTLLYEPYVQMVAEKLQTGLEKAWTTHQLLD